jgi:hypothetical protein
LVRRFRDRFNDFDRTVVHALAAPDATNRVYPCAVGGKRDGPCGTHTLARSAQNATATDGIFGFVHAAIVTQRGDYRHLEFCTVLILFLPGFRKR